MNHCELAHCPFYISLCRYGFLEVLEYFIQYVANPFFQLFIFFQISDLIMVGFALLSLDLLHIIIILQLYHIPLLVARVDP